MMMSLDDIYLLYLVTFHFGPLHYFRFKSDFIPQVLFHTVYSVFFAGPNNIAHYMGDFVVSSKHTL